VDGRPYEDNPILRRSMPIQHYVHGKILRLYWLAAEGVDPGLVAHTAHREVSEFVRAAFLPHGTVKIERK
jgi:hypothetical protein